jgi:hypothetical protein
MAYASAVPLTVVDITRAGVLIDAAMRAPTATHGDKIPNDGRTFLRVKNGSASPITVTVDTPGSVDGQAITDLALTIAAGEDRLFGPFSTTFQQSDGFIWALCSSVATITVGAYRIAG